MPAWAELERLSNDESLFSDPRRVTEKKTGLVRSIFDVRDCDRNTDRNTDRDDER